MGRFRGRAYVPPQRVQTVACSLCGTYVTTKESSPLFDTEDGAVAWATWKTRDLARECQYVETCSHYGRSEPVTIEEHFEKLGRSGRPSDMMGVIYDDRQAHIDALVKMNVLAVSHMAFAVKATGTAPLYVVVQHEHKWAVSGFGSDWSLLLYCQGCRKAIEVPNKLPIEVPNG